MILNYVRREALDARPEDAARDVAARLRDTRASAAVVVQHGRPVGLVTARDLATALADDGGDPRERRVSDVMTPRPVCVRESEGFDRALELMAQHGVRRLPVVDTQGRLRGLVSLDDLLEDICGDMRVIGRLLRAQQERRPELASR